MVTDLGAGEREVLALALETPDCGCVLDDALARQIASALQLRITGTLGILIDAKRTALIPLVRPQLDQLHNLGFRLAAHTRAAVLKMAGESRIDAIECTVLRTKEIVDFQVPLLCGNR